MDLGYNLIDLAEILQTCTGIFEYEVPDFTFTNLGQTFRAEVSVASVTPDVIFPVTVPLSLFQKD